MNYTVDPITQFARENNVPDTMLWRKSYEQQICFVRDFLFGMFVNTYEEFKEFSKGIEINSTHTSKSIKLPVYTLKVKGWEFTLRDNFYDWKVSVEPPKDFYNGSFPSRGFKDLFDGKEIISSCYCEGFPEHKVFKSYLNYVEYGRGGFTVSIKNDYNLYTFFYLLKQYMK